MPLSVSWLTLDLAPINWTPGSSLIAVPRPDIGIYNGAAAQIGIQDEQRVVEARERFWLDMMTRLESPEAVLFCRGIAGGHYPKVLGGEIAFQLVWLIG